jgi:predicted RND superfamily exporter protein
MKQLQKKLAMFFESLPDALRRKKWYIWSLFLALTIFLFMGISRNTFDMSMDSWFSDSDPTKQALNYFKHQFGSDDVVYLVYRPKDGDLFSKNSLAAIMGIREEILNFRENLPKEKDSMLSRVTRVDTIASVKILTAKEDALVARRFIHGDLPETKEERVELRKQALLQKTFPLYYFSKGFEYGAMVIQTDLGTEPLNAPKAANRFEEEEVFGDFDMEVEMDTESTSDNTPPTYKPVEMAAYTAMMEDINAVIQQSEYADHLDYHPVGNPYLMAYFTRQMEETGPLFLAMLVVIVILLWRQFHSFSAVVWATLLVVITCIWTLGVSGWFGETVTTMITLTIMLILAVGIADAAHIISGYLLYRKEGLSHEKALRTSFNKAGLPCLLTTATTMVGMLSLTLSSINHIRTFGYMSALGVGFAFLITVFVLPLMLDLWAPIKKGTVNGRKEKPRRFSLDSVALARNFLGRVLPLVKKSPLLIIAIFMVIFVACVVGATRVKVDSNMVASFKKKSELRTHYDVVDTHMAGTNTMEIFIDGGKSDSLLDPRVIKVMDRLQQTIETKYPHLVARTFSLANIVKDAYQVLNDGDDAFYRVPETSALLTQTLFMFNNANPEDRRRLVSDDYRKTHISVQLYNAGSHRYTAFFNDVKKEIDAAFFDLHKEHPQFTANITGSLALIMKLADYIGWSQIKSLGAVIGIITLIMVFIFGSTRVGGLSIIPNLMPATLIFGLLGFLGIALDADTMIIAPVIIGIAVDDTIHFITHYRDEVVKDGDILRSISNTIYEVGQAITFTTLVLGFGFLMLAFSSNTSFIKVGIFGSLAIFAALLCDLFLLPALILTFKPKFSAVVKKQALTTTETSV